MMACGDPQQFAATVGPVCGARGYQSRECRDAVREALRRHGNGCLATSIVPGWPPLVRYVCPSTDDYLGPLCPGAPSGGTVTPGTTDTAETTGTPDAAGQRRYMATLGTAGIASAAVGGGIAVAKLGPVLRDLMFTKRAITKTDAAQDALSFADAEYYASVASRSPGTDVSAGLDSTVDILQFMSGINEHVVPPPMDADDIVHTVRSKNDVEEVLAHLRNPSVGDPSIGFVNEHEGLIRDLHQQFHGTGGSQERASSLQRDLTAAFDGHRASSHIH